MCQDKVHHPHSVCNQLHTQRQTTALITTQWSHLYRTVHVYTGLLYTCTQDYCTPVHWDKLVTTHHSCNTHMVQEINSLSICIINNSEKQVWWGWLSCMVYCQPIVTIRIQNIPLEVQSTGVVSYNYFIFPDLLWQCVFWEKNCNEEDKSLKG